MTETAARPARIVLSLLALAAGPTAWALQLLAGYGVSSPACFPHDAPFRTSPPPGWSGEPVLLLLINLACLALAAGGLGLAFVLWRAGKAQHSERTRFLAASGLFAGAAFVIAILFDTAPILSVPPCWSIAS